MAPLSIEYDPEVDALYVRFSDLPVVNSVEQDHCVLDVAGDQTVVGIEIVNPEPSVLSKLAVEHGFSDSLAHIEAAMTPQHSLCTASTGIGYMVATHAAASQSAPSLPVRELEIA